MRLIRSQDRSRGGRQLAGVVDIVARNAAAGRGIEVDEDGLGVLHPIWFWPTFRDGPPHDRSGTAVRP